MNPGVVEEASKTINNVVDALKATPMTIAMIATNISLIVFLFYSQSQFYHQRQDLSKAFLDSEQEVRRLLASCYIPSNQMPPIMPKVPDRSE